MKNPASTLQAPGKSMESERAQNMRLLPGSADSKTAWMKNAEQGFFMPENSEKEYFFTPLASLKRGKKMNLFSINFECWLEENEEALFEEYYESGACYDSSFEWFADKKYDEEIERKSK